MTNFAKYLQTVVEKAGYVDLQGTSGLYLVKVVPFGKTEQEAEFFSIPQNAEISDLSKKLRELSINKKFSKQLTVSLGIGNVNYDNSTPLNKIFHDNLIEFKVEEVPGKKAQQVILVTKPK